ANAALANYAVHTPYFGHGAQLRFDFLSGRVGSIQCRRRGHRKGDVELALIAVGKEVEPDEAEHQQTNAGREARQANGDDSPPLGSDQPSRRPYPRSSWSKPASHTRPKRASGEVRMELSVRRRKKRASIGVSVNETASDDRVAAVITTANGCRNCAGKPV